MLDVEAGANDTIVDVDEVGGCGVDRCEIEIAGCIVTCVVPLDDVCIFCVTGDAVICVNVAIDAGNIVCTVCG